MTAIPAEFHWVHNIALDSNGNIYTTEVDTGKRAQKFDYVTPTVRREETGGLRQLFRPFT